MLWISLIAGALTCATIAAIIAHLRGGEGLLGFACGLFFGPLGIVAAIFLGDEQGRAAKRVRAGRAKKCPMCAEAVLAEALICRFCGHRFDRELVLNDAAPPRAPVDLAKLNDGFDRLMMVALGLLILVVGALAIASFR